jgi:uncharacterized alkaline shock family protein YloU
MRRGMFAKKVARNLHDEPAYKLGVAVAQLKDVLSVLDIIVEPRVRVVEVAESLRRDVERTLREVDR